MNWLERLGRVIRTNINSLIQEAQDPEKILEQAIADMEKELIEMRRALAEAIATSKSTERQAANYQATARQWYERAQLALEKGNEELAREALAHRQSYLNHARSLQEQVEQQSGIIKKFKQDLRLLECQFTEAKAKKSLYVARLRSAMASQRIQEIAGNLNSGRASGIFEQIESKILELEAESELLAGAENDPLEQKFATLEGTRQIELELENLKMKRLKGQN